MWLSLEGRKFIQGWESCRLKAYRDVAGVWTIGWGTVVRPNGLRVSAGDVISQSLADYYFLIETTGIAEKLDAVVLKLINQNQADALISFSYNLGVQALRSSTLLKVINTGGKVMEDHFTRWNKAHVDGKLVAVKGLTARRRAEFELYVKQGAKAGETLGKG